MAFPGNPYSGRGTVVDFTSVGGGFGNIYYPSGANNVPFIIDVTNNMAADLTQNGIMGNKFQLHSLKLSGLIRTLENQATYDEWIGRVSVLRLKQDGFAAGVTSAIGLARYLQFPSTGAAAGGNNSWFDSPWDLTKCKVLYDKKWMRHATPTTVAAQANCQFKSVPINCRLRWKKGLPINWNTQTNVTGSSATVTKVINPIIIVFQSGATGAVAAVNEPLPGFFAFNSGQLYMGYRDA